MTETVQTKLYQIFERHNSNSNNILHPEEINKLIDEIRLTSEENDSIGLVEEFMITFDQKIGKKAEEPTEDIKKLRLSLMLEELCELAEACGSTTCSNFSSMLHEKSMEMRDKAEKGREHMKWNPVAVLDALGDQRYVNDGTILAFGLKRVFEEAFEEIHNSNMSKACNNENEVINTIGKYKEEGIEVLPLEKGSKTLILRTDDRKVMKSINYNPANLTHFIDELQTLNEPN